ncbi:MAG: hypothetical protein ACLQBA_13940 [Candidatus Binataceae bacterium]
MKHAYLSVLIALALFSTTGSVCRSDEKHQNQSRPHDRSTSHKANLPPSPFTIIVQPAPVQIIQPSPTIEKEKPTQEWYYRPTITDWGILGVTLIYTVISLGLLNATRKQARLAIYTLVQSRKAVNAASASNRQNRELAEMELRAYVHVSSGEILNYDNMASRKARITIRNFGQTPAYNVTFWLNTWVEEFPLKIILPPPPDDFPMSREIMAPGRVSTNEVPVVATIPCIEGHLQLGAIAIFAYGEIRYRDAFNIERFTKFRLVCRGDGLNKGRMSPDRTGNEAN